MTPSPQAGYSKRSRLDKLGVKPDMRIAVLSLEDPWILKELRERTDDVATTRPRKDTDMILVGIDGPGDLARLPKLQGQIRRNGMIWAIWPKGMSHINGNMVRSAALAAGLVDVKVMAFSETLSGLKLVIPVAKR